MIKIVEGYFDEVKGTACTIRTEEEEIKGIAVRDEEGNLIVTVEGSIEGSVTLIVHDGNDSTYTGDFR